MKYCAMCKVQRPDELFRYPHSSYCNPCANEYARQYYHRRVKPKKGVSTKKSRDRSEEWRRHASRITVEAIMAYGGKCYCCGYDDFRFLTLDHANNDGMEHRRELNSPGGVRFYEKLKALGWPQDRGIRVACFNCNCGRGHGECPHTSQGSWLEWRVLWKKIRKEFFHPKRLELY
jgi:hypothetical protein